MNGAQYIAEQFKEYGVTHMFFVPVIMHEAQKEMLRLGISTIMTHGEKSAAYMADGYARVSGRPGVCGAQAVGSANLAAGLRDAYLSCTPIIAITGGHHPDHKHRFLYQEMNDFPMFEPLTKFNATVDTAERIPDLLRQAFRSATTACPGPVHLELQGFIGQVVESELSSDIKGDNRFGSYPAFRPAAEDADIEAAISLLASAQRPVIVAGGGVRISRAQKELVELAKHLFIPVATSPNGKSAIPEDNPLSIGVVGDYSRECTNRIVYESDLVFYVGSRTGGLVTKNWKIPPEDTKVIHLDIEAENIGRNFPNTAALCGDAKTILNQIKRSTKTITDRKDWMYRIDALRNDWHNNVANNVHSEKLPLRPERLCYELSSCLPDNGIIFVDTGHATAWTAQHFEITHPQQEFHRAAGSLGWAFPAAIGAKCAAPERPVICFTGDGGFYYHIAELETMSRYGINVIVIVNNNSGLNQEKFLWDDDSLFENNWRFNHNDFAEIAKCMGCEGIRVQTSSEIHDAMQQAISYNKPVVIDVTTDINAIAPFGWAPEMGCGIEY